MYVDMKFVQFSVYSKCILFSINLYVCNNNNVHRKYATCPLCIHTEQCAIQWRVIEEKKKKKEDEDEDQDWMVGNHFKPTNSDTILLDFYIIFVFTLVWFVYCFFHLLLLLLLLSTHNFTLEPSFSWQNTHFIQSMDIQVHTISSWLL